MKQSRCALCDVEISEDTDSDEHIIPNSIGGRLKTKGFICKSCNNKSGELWDYEISDQFNHLSLFFGIVRERGKTPSKPVTTTAGERLILMPDGGLSLAKPEYREEVTASGVQIQIVARNKGEARKMLAGVKRKYPKADVSGILEQSEIILSQPKGLVHFNISFGGEIAGRSIVKSAMAYSHYIGINSGDCELGTNYLRVPTSKACFGYYYEKDLIQGRPAGIPLHCVAVQGNPDTGLLLGYVEYFGVQRIVVCLSERYTGPHLNSAHAINPLNGKTFPVTVSLPFSPDHIDSIYRYEKAPPAELGKAFDQVLPAALRRQFDREKERVIDEAVRFAFANCGAKEGEILTPEHVKKLSGLASARLAPFILRNIRPGRTPPRAG